MTFNRESLVTLAKKQRVVGWAGQGLSLVGLTAGNGRLCHSRCSLEWGRVSSRGRNAGALGPGEAGRASGAVHAAAALQPPKCGDSFG